MKLMKVIRAEALGLCFGVRDALALADSVAEPESVTVHGELVHNETVLVQLRSRGFQMTGEQERHAMPQTPRVLVTAHGISDVERRRLESEGRELLDTTCPLVARVHRAARELEAGGYHVILIGRPGHVEVRGIVEDLSSCDVVAGVEDVRAYGQRRLGVICQTTTPPRIVAPIIAAVRERNPDTVVRVIDTVCQPTRDRQEAVERLLPAVDAMVIVGGKNSNNTRKLTAICRERSVPAYHVQSAADLVPEWFADCRTVGLTAGTSTLDATIEEVQEALGRMEGSVEC